MGIFRPYFLGYLVVFCAVAVKLVVDKDFPSVLVEMGFISNEEECMAMANELNQDGMATALANGVYNYFARSYISYSGNGSDSIPDQSWDDPSDDETEEPEALPETEESWDSDETVEEGIVPDDEPIEE